MKVQDPRDILRHILARVSPFLTENVELTWRRVSFDQKVAPEPHRIFLTLVYGLDYRYVSRPFEKMAWLIPITFDGIPMYIAHQKFGLWVASANSSDAQRALPELFACLRKAERVTERFLQQEVEARIRKGRVTVENQFYNTKDRYLFFRQLATRAYSSKPPPPKTRKVKWGPVASVTSFDDPFKPKREGFYFASAAVDAYFAHLEHVLVFLLPFLGYRPDRDDLVSYIGMTWSEKFKRVFDLSVNKRARTIFEELREVKERLRNAVAHGGFEKGASSLLVHFEGTGAIPATLSTRSDEGLFRLFPIHELDFEKACRIFDETDRLLRESEARYGYRYAEAGLSVAFSTDVISSYEEAMVSDETFAALIDKNAYLHDMCANMDW